MTTLAIVFWTLTGIVFLAAMGLLLLSLFDIINLEIVGFAFVITIILGTISTAETVHTNPKPKVEEYPLSEWRVDYKITTMNDKSDTTLVLTKKNKMSFIRKI